MKLCAPVPVFGRFPLVRMTISRLKAQDVIPIMLGHEDEAEAMAKELDVEFIRVANDPLGNKWNAGFEACKNYQADGVIFMGSSDWASDEYIESVKDALKDFPFIGMLGCHFADVGDEVRLVHWPGYQRGQRQHNKTQAVNKKKKRIVNYYWLVVQPVKREHNSKTSPKKKQSQRLFVE